MPTGNFYYVTIHYNSLTLAGLIGLQDGKVKAEGGGRFCGSVVAIYTPVYEAPSPFPPCSYSPKCKREFSFSDASEMKNLFKYEECI